MRTEYCRLLSGLLFVQWLILIYNGGYHYGEYSENFKKMHADSKGTVFCFKVIKLSLFKVE